MSDPQPWNGLTTEQIRKLNAYIDELGPYLMESFSTVGREENTMQWDGVHNVLKGHLRVSLLMSIKDTVDKLSTLPSLQGKVIRSR
jgi:hypothetical protein